MSALLHVSDKEFARLMKKAVSVWGIDFGHWDKLDKKDLYGDSTTDKGEPFYDYGYMVVLPDGSSEIFTSNEFIELLEHYLGIGQHANRISNTAYRTALDMLRNRSLYDIQVELEQVLVELGNMPQAEANRNGNRLMMTNKNMRGAIEKALTVLKDYTFCVDDTKH